MHFESEVHPRCQGPGGSLPEMSMLVTTRSCPPRCGTTISATVVGEVSRMKARNSPLGDQAGPYSLLGVAVKREGGSTPICLI